MNLQQLREKRARLMREAEALRGANGTFANDQARADCESRVTEMEQIDREIARLERGQSEFLTGAQPGAGRLALESQLEPQPAATTEPTEIERGVTAERERAQGILLAVRAAGLPSSFADQLIKDGVPLVEAQSRVFKEMQGRRDPTGAPNGSARAQVQVGDSPHVHERAGIEEALLHRVNPQAFKLTDRGRQYRGMSFLDIARVFLTSAGIRTSSMSRMEIATAALGMGMYARGGGYHTTSDFPLLLADVGNKQLRAAYAEAPQTFKAIGRQANLPDFKPVYRNQLGDAPQLLKVPQHGEFKRGTIGEARETYQLATYGRIFGVTRQAIVNDDLDAFSRVPADFGRESRNLESNLAWEQITGTTPMGDGLTLFHATHGNLDSVGALIGVPSIGRGRAAIRQQRGLGSADQQGHRMNLTAKWLIVPTMLETKADQFVTNVVANKADDVNPFGGRLQVLAEPRLDDDSETAWYLSASNDQIAILEYGYLEGEEGPMLEIEPGFHIDGLSVKCRLDFAAKAIDFRGIFKNVGEAEPT